MVTIGWALQVAFTGAAAAHGKELAVMLVAVWVNGRDPRGSEPWRVILCGAVGGSNHFLKLILARTGRTDACAEAAAQAVGSSAPPL